MIRRALAIFVVGISAAATSMAAVEYTGDRYRDPFQDSSAIQMSNKALAGQPSAKPEASLVLEGLLWNSRTPHAIISGRIVEVGSRIGLNEVTRIDERGVTLSYNGQERILSRKGRNAT